jgi:hypothetical protein
MSTREESELAREAARRRARKRLNAAWRRFDPQKRLRKTFEAEAGKKMILCGAPGLGKRS